MQEVSVSAHQHLREQKIMPLFVSYLIPAVLGMVLMSVNIIIDGIMVSRGVGANALAGVNVSLPAFSIIFSISLWISIGGATLYSMALGENDIPRAQSVFTHSIITAIVVVLFITMICLWNLERVALLFGANEVILPYSVDYLRILFTFGIVYVLESVLSTFIRNDGNPNLAMAGLITTAVLNIILNYFFIFVYGWGVQGSAAATILSAAIGFLVLLTHFMRKDSILKLTSIRWDWTMLRHIIVIGFPSFVTEFAVAIVTILFNITFISYLGETGVASYAIVNSIHSMMLLVFLGVGAALQPISSFHYGAELFDRLKQALRLAIKTAVWLGAVAIIVGYFGADYLILLFGVESEQLFTMTSVGIGLFFLQYLFLGYNMVYAEYYQSINQTGKSLAIILSRGLILLLPLIWILPNWFGATAIWLVAPTAEAITALVLFIFVRRNKQQRAVMRPS
ncbi:MATE family efflux transporter [Paenibacillus terrigena]|uniref:MATE family efflux transporter n=1 Tax=Paenibacillus terrigena TaxID=369333 RepID=UPI0028CFEDDD|nr:MATE family efflux transporter [Paenibacillus terrigena]